jgi:hypothetical protein
MKIFSVGCKAAATKVPSSKISNSILTSLGGGDSAAQFAVIDPLLRQGFKRQQIKRVNLGITLSKDWLTYAIVNTLTDTGSGVLHWTGSKWLVATGPGTYETNCPLPANIEKKVFNDPPCPK